MAPYSDAVYADMRRDLNCDLLTAAPWAVVGSDEDTSAHQDRPDVTTTYIWPYPTCDDALVLASVRDMPAVRLPRRIVGDTALPGVVTVFGRRGDVRVETATRTRRNTAEIRRPDRLVGLVMVLMLVVIALRGGQR